MRFNPTEKLLLACATTAGNQVNLNGPIDWEYLLKLGAGHQIMPLVYHNLKHAPIPEAIKGRLKEYYLANMIRSLRLEAEQKRIIEMLEAQGIDCIPLKGTAFAKQVYGDIALRQTSDIDILVREKDLFRAKEMLLSHGYRRTGRSDAFYLEDSCHLVFSKGNYLIELHWNIGPYNNIKVSADYPWQEVSRKCFSPEMTLAFMVLKFNFDSFYSLRYLVDIVETIRYYKAGMDWEKYGQILKTYRAKQVFCLCLKLIEVLFEEKYPWEEMQLPRPSFFRKMLLSAFPTGQMVRTPGYKRAWRLLFLDDYGEVLPLIWGYFHGAKKE